MRVLNNIRYEKFIGEKLPPLPMEISLVIFVVGSTVLLPRENPFM